ncbi:uncharacterized protein LOC100181403 [Ciona intestinalis]
MYTTRQKQTRVPDARLRLQSKFNDARSKLTKRRPKEEPVFDARQAIKAKKAPSPITIERKPIKVVSEKPVEKKSLKLTTRTIRNPGAVVPLENQTVGKNVLLRSKQIGFVSVTNGSRVLMEKVTMGDTGLKVAIRNDIMKEKPTRRKNNNNKQGDSSVKVNKGIKITMTNPDAEKKPSPKPSKTNVQRKQPAKPKKRSLPPPPPSPTPSPEPEVVHHHRIPHESPPAPKRKYMEPAAPMYSDIIIEQKRPKHQYIHPRPMNSGENSVFFQERVRQYDPHPQIAETDYPHEYISPFEGTKILVSNLHPIVVEDDILELFSVLGPVRRARMVGPGKAEIVFIRRDDAILAYQKYNNRDLDGQPMQMKLLLQESNPQCNVQYSWMSDITPRRSTAGADITEIDPNILQRALFKGGSTGTSTRPVTFTVKI